MLLTPVDEIKQRLDIVDVVQGYIKLQKAGINFKASCPFHNEKTPSFFVSPDRQTWHCFGCSKGGDAFSFVQEIEGIEFKDALRLLAQRAGVALQPPSPQAAKAQEQKTRIAQANELACQFFETQLARASSGNAAKVYLKTRGVEEATLAAFRIGFAPYTHDALSRFLLSRGFSEEELASAGLVTRPAAPRDRFRGRIMFPIVDRAGRVLGFSGRIFGREEGEYDPKYINTSQTTLFDKSRVLFGLAQAHEAIRKKGTVVLVEGQMDCVLSHQAGAAHAVATSGTALTSFQLSTLKRLADTLIFAFDADLAGEAAARRGVDVALGQGFLVKVAEIPSGKDPADFIRHNPGEWQAQVMQPVHIIQFFLSRSLARNDIATPEGKRNVAQQILPLLALVGNAIEQSHWVKEVAQKLSVREETVWEELARLPKDPVPRERKVTGKDLPVEQKELSRRTRIERQLLAALFAHSGNAPQVPEELFMDDSLRAIVKGFQAASSQEAMREALPETLRQEAEGIAFLAEELRAAEVDVARECEWCMRELSTITLRERLDALAQELEFAERSGDAIRTEELTTLVREHSQKLYGALQSADSRDQ